MACGRDGEAVTAFVVALVVRRSALLGLSAETAVGRGGLSCAASVEPAVRTATPVVARADKAASGCGSVVSAPC